MLSMDGYQFSCFCFLFSQFFFVSVIPKLYLSTGTASDPIASILFFALYSVPKTNLNLLKYSFFNLSFSFLSSMLWLSSIPKYLNTFLRTSSWMIFSNVFPVYVFLWMQPFFLIKFLETFLIQIHINVFANCFHKFYFILQSFLTSAWQFQVICIQ